MEDGIKCVPDRLLTLRHCWGSSHFPHGFCTWQKALQEVVVCLQIQTYQRLHNRFVFYYPPFFFCSVARASDTAHDDFAPAAMWSYHMVKEGCSDLTYFISRNLTVLHCHFTLFSSWYLFWYFYFIFKKSDLEFRLLPEPL